MQARCIVYGGRAGEMREGVRCAMRDKNMWMEPKVIMRFKKRSSDMS